jgi:CheY-like chemotaxis protein
MVRFVPDHRMPHAHPTVLLIDDHDDLRDGLSTLLTLEGYTVEAVSDGQAALEMLRQGFHPCIIVLDLNMPVMDGYEFRRQQLRDPDLARIPVITYSAVADIAEAFADLKATAYLQKPGDFPTLMSLIRQHCLK